MRAIYVRVSQDRTGLSTSTTDQLAECREFCVARGWDATEFVDHDVSASSVRKVRPQWSQMLKRLDDIEAIVCWSSDRLYRQPRDLEVLIDRAERGALTIFALHSSELDLSTPEGRAVARTLSAWNRAEVERLAARVRRKHASLASEGKFGGGPRPFGFTPDGMATVPEEATLIREAASAMLSGASLSSIAREWNKQGVRTPIGNPWRPSALRRVISSKRVAGLHPSTGKRAAWPAIVQRRVHLRIVDLLSDEARRTSPKNGRYLLTGLATCGLCEGNLSGRPQKDVRRYICRKTGRVHLAVDAERLESHVLEAAQEHIPPEPEVVVDPATLSAPILEALEQVDAALENWGRRSALGEVTEAEYRGARTALVERQAELEAQLADVQPDKPESLWPDVSLFTSENVRLWMESLVDRIVVGPAKVPGAGFDSKRIRIEWR